MTNEKKALAVRGTRSGLKRDAKIAGIGAATGIVLMKVGGSLIFTWALPVVAVGGGIILGRKVLDKWLKKRGY